MRNVYLDTSAAMKLVVQEAETDALLAELSGAPLRLVASWLLHAELHCAADRNPREVSLDEITAVLQTVALFDVTRGDLLAAGTLAPLRSNDAIHLAAALRLGVDAIATYDVELGRAAASAGLEVLAPAG